MSKWTKRRTGANDGWFIHDGFGHRVASVEDNDDHATLIASAPALLEALELLVEMYVDQPHEGDDPETHLGVIKARAALSLAKGTQGETR